jgi:lipid-binding SYLF domain-containing protein
MGDSSETRAIQTTRDIVQFIDANGVFAGAALDGAVIAPDPRRPGR